MKLIVLIFISQFSFAITELSGNFGYDRQVFGSDRQNKLTSTNYGGNIAFYFWGLTALEFNYYQNNETIEDNDRRQLDTNFAVLQQKDRVLSEVFGIGIRQAFASRKAFLQPVISIGYAKQFVNNSVEYTTDESGVIGTEKFQVEKSRQDSVFATFSVRIKITKSLTLNGSVRTVFKYDEMDEARDNVKYLAGFSWFL